MSKALNQTQIDKARQRIQDGDDYTADFALDKTIDQMIDDVIGGTDRPELRSVLPHLDQLEHELTAALNKVTRYLEDFGRLRDTAQRPEVRAAFADLRREALLAQGKLLLAAQRDRGDSDVAGTIGGGS